jgi:ribosomal protein L24
MASVIRIKRSSVAGNPATLAAGELAYSSLSGTQANGGDRLYIGMGSETGGNAANHFVIGGKYFTDLLDHVAGTVTAGSALIVDSNSKIDVLNVDNITINGNDISTTDTNGNLTLTPNGTGGVVVSTGHDLTVENLTNGRLVFASTGGKLADTSNLLWDAANNKLVITGMFATDNIQIDGSTISNTASNANLVLATNGTGKISINNWFTLPNSTGTSGYVLTSDGVGGTTWQQSSSQLAISGDTGSDTVSLLNDTLAVNGGEGIDVAVTNNTITISGEDASSANKGIASFAASYFTVTNGDVAINNASTSTKGIASFDATDFSVSSGAVNLQVERIEDIAGGLFTGNVTQNITSTYDDSSGKIDLFVSTATWSTLGVARFTSSTFSVTDGNVSVKTGGISNTQLANSAVTIGSTSISLGASSTVLSGLTEVTVDNVKIYDYTIEALNTATFTIVTQNSATIQFSNARLTNLAEPQNDQDAATKYYVDSVAQGLHTHFAADAATTQTLALSVGGTVTYTTVTNGVGDYLTFSSALNTLDGYSLVNGDRVLVKNETTTAYNGVYIRTNATTFTRAEDMNQPADLAGGDFIFVVHGQVNGDTGWVQTEEVATVGSSPIVFTQFSGAGTYIGGDGLTLTGNVFSVNATNGIEVSNDNVQLASSVAGAGLTYSLGVLDIGGTAGRITVNADSIDIASSYTGQTSIVTVGTITSGTWQANTVGASYGGTGFTSYSAYDLLVGNIGGSLSKLTKGAAGTVLQVSADGTALEYADLDGGTY